MTSKKHFISGITGQDGVFLTLEILKNESNPIILGTSRNEKSIVNFYSKLKYKDLNINLENVNIKKSNLEDLHETKVIIKNFKPDIVYNLSGPSSVYDSFSNPDKFKKSIESIFYNILQACVDLDPKPTIFQPSSSEMFSNKNELPFNENSFFESRSPYGEAKLKIHSELVKLRKKHHITVVNGILFNHESEFRPDNFLLPKLINSAFNIKHNNQKRVVIGSLDIVRDWSYAGDVASAIYLISKLGKNEDFVIGSGKGTSTRELVKNVFLNFNLDYKDYVLEDSSILRKNDPRKIICNPNKIYEHTGWTTKVNIEDIILKYINLNFLR